MCIYELSVNSLSCVWLFATPWTVPTRFLCPWNSPFKNTRIGSHSLFQGYFPTLGLNQGLLHCRQILYPLIHQMVCVCIKWYRHISHLIYPFISLWTFRLFPGPCLFMYLEKSESEVAQLCLTLWNPIYCSLPGSSVHGIFHARILEWLPFCCIGDLSDQGLNPGFPHCKWKWSHSVMSDS